MERGYGSGTGGYWRCPRIAQAIGHLEATWMWTRKSGGSTAGVVD